MTEEEIGNAGSKRKFLRLLLKHICKVQRIFPKIHSSYSELYPQCVCFGLFGSRTLAVSRHSLARQYSTQSYCLLSAYPTLSCTLSGRGYNWLLITLQPTRMLNRSSESAWRDMASNQRCFILIPIRAMLHAICNPHLYNIHQSCLFTKPPDSRLLS